MGIDIIVFIDGNVGRFGIDIDNAFTCPDAVVGIPGACPSRSTDLDVNRIVLKVGGVVGIPGQTPAIYANGIISGRMDIERFTLHFDIHVPAQFDSAGFSIRRIGTDRQVIDRKVGTARRSGIDRIQYVQAMNRRYR